MTSNRTRRIAKELADIKNDKHSRITVVPTEDGSDLTKLDGFFPGPPDTPYEGGVYHINIEIPNDYPFRPPKMKFKTKLWHPNVSSQTGAICLDTLAAAWSPVLTIKSALISLQSLLCSPEPRDPQDSQVASMMLQDKEGFEAKAAEWARMYAGAPDKGKYSGSGGQSTTQLAEKTPEQLEMERKEQYRGFNEQMVHQFTEMGFQISQVVQAFMYQGIPRGQFTQLSPGESNDVVATLLHNN